MQAGLGSVQSVLENKIQGRIHPDWKAMGDEQNGRSSHAGEGSKDCGQAMALKQA
jgi:hypothetical protein